MSNLYKPTRHDQSVALGASALYTPLTQGLIGYWRMEEAAWNGSIGEVKDSSGNSGTVSQNLILNSNDLTAAGWSSSGTPIVTSTTLEDNDAGAMEGVLFTVNPIKDEDFYTMSCKVPIKGSAPSYYAGIMIWLYIGGTSIQAGITIDPYNKTITPKSTGGGTVAPYATSIEEVGTDLLVSLTLQNNGTSNTFARADYYPAVNTDGSGTWLVTAQGVNTFTDMQLENSSALGPFVATTGSAITNSYNHGKAFNGATTIAGGKLGRGGDFVVANTDYIEFANNTEIQLLNGGAMFGWIYPRTAGGLNFGRVASGSQDKWSLFVTATGMLTLSIVDGGANRSSSASAITFNAWNHIVVNIATTGVTFYVNGIDVTSVTGDGSLPVAGTGVWRIGSKTADTVRSFDGIIDEFGFYNRIININEIEQQYNGGLGLAII